MASVAQATRPRSLWDAVASFLRIPLDERLKSEVEEHWRLLIKLVRADEGFQFLATLSAAELNSLRVLALWYERLVPAPWSYSTLWAGHQETHIDLVFHRLLFREMQAVQGDSDEKSAYRMESGLDFYRKLAAQGYGYRRLLKSFLESEFGLRQLDGEADPEEERLLDIDCPCGPLSSTLAPCQWLEHYPASNSLPYYLWDAIDQRTVEARHLADPRYVVISHTWGRWRTPTFDASGNEVAGIDLGGRVPWRVPENSLFSVAELPEGLRQLTKSLSLRYAWIDLFCIPQDGSLRAQQEISRQAAIFGGADIAVVWMNTCTSWSLMRDVVAWMILNTLDGTPPEEFRMNTVPGASAEEPNQELRMLEMHPQLAARFDSLTSTLSSTSTEEWDLPTEIWFTSLWTLQEAYLRPDMLLANAAFDLFSIADQTDPVPLDTLMHLSSISKCWPSSDAQQARDPVPGPAAEVISLHIRQDLLHCHNSHPLEILIMGSTRECQESRSEAIMSVLGCVDWHRRAVATGKEGSPLLLFGQYEYAFLQEVLQKYRLAFFSSASVTSHAFRDALEAMMPAATILPFSVIRGTEKKMFPADMLSASRHHTSLNTWELLPDGSVRVPQAYVMHYTPPESATSGNGTAGLHRDMLYKQDCRISAPPEGFESKGEGDDMLLEQQMEPLGSWMERAWKGLAKYAVFLLSAPGWVHGLILAEIGPKNSCHSSSSKILAKLGDFHFEYSETLPPFKHEEVDWLIY
ncbi:hypothetical protein BDV10DRAFT_189559 [Aspergillus recurvatus]